MSSKHFFSLGLGYSHLPARPSPQGWTGASAPEGFVLKPRSVSVQPPCSAGVGGGGEVKVRGGQWGDGRGSTGEKEVVLLRRMRESISGVDFL